MAMRRYEISLRVLKNTQEKKFRELWMPVVQVKRESVCSFSIQQI